jgi:hypothetical protein
MLSTVNPTLPMNTVMNYTVWKTIILKGRVTVIQVGKGTRDSVKIRWVDLYYDRCPK